MYQYVGHYDGDLGEPLRQTLEFELLPNAQGLMRSSPLADEDLIAKLQPLLADALPGRWTNVLVTRIMPSGTIPLHVDGARAGTRYHLVLETNTGCWCMHDGDWQQLGLGDIYTMEQTRPHGSVNWGETPRTHLVVDIKEAA